MKNYYVYIITNKPFGVFYTGFTNNISRRILEHKTGIMEGFSKRYKLHKLVYYEIFEDVNSAIAREKTIKKWRRKTKYDAIEKLNPEWKDLYFELNS